MERAELHFHLLPGVDDGPGDMDGALELARAAVADGTRLVTCTPHAHTVDFAEVPDRVHELRAALAAAGIPLELRPGTELSWDDVFRADDPGLASLAHGPVGRRWLLLETPLPGFGDLASFEAAAEELRERGYGLLIAHPERSPAVSTTPGAIDRLIELGDRIQVNATAFTGFHGEAARIAAHELVRSGRASVLASDAHDLARAPSLSAAVAALREDGMASADAERLVSEAPRALLESGIAPARRLAA